MNEEFPELGLTENGCSEVSWIESVMFIGGYNTSTTKPDYLLQRIPAFKLNFKGKSDMVKAVIPKAGLEGLCNAVRQSNGSLVAMTPYGGRMAEIREDATPFPHRKGVFYMIQYVAQWYPEDKWPEVQNRDETWVRGLYNYMTPYVSSNPRQAYANYRDLDLGRDANSCPNCSCPNIWGYKYFKNNFMRLVAAKTKADFFLHEQSIPTYSTLNTCIPLVS